MAYSPARRKRRPMSEINVVPYIDVMLVLLIIFMVTAPLLQQGVEVDLPDAPSETLPDDSRQQEPLIVSVDKVGRFYLNQNLKPRKPIELDALKDRVKELISQQPDLQVYVRGDDQVAYGRVVTAMVVLQNAGADNIGLITEPPPSNPGSN